MSPRLHELAIDEDQIIVESAFSTTSILASANIGQSIKSYLSKFSHHLPASQALIVGSILIILQALDGILTGMGVERFGLHMEGNPFLRLLMAEFGHVPTLAALKFVAISIVVLLTIMVKRVPWVENAMSAISCLYILVAILPWTYILFIKPYI